MQIDSSTQAQMPLPSAESALKEVVQRSFETSPDTVYGVLVMLLVVAVIWLAWMLFRKDKKLLELNLSTIDVLNDLNTSLMLLEKAGVQLGDDLKEQLKYTREHVITHLKNLNHGKDTQ